MGGYYGRRSVIVADVGLWCRAYGSVVASRDSERTIIVGFAGSPCPEGAAAFGQLRSVECMLLAVADEARTGVPVGAGARAGGLVELRVGAR